MPAPALEAASINLCTGILQTPHSLSGCAAAPSPRTERVAPDRNVARLIKHRTLSATAELTSHERPGAGAQTSHLLLQHPPRCFHDTGFNQTTSPPPTCKLVSGISAGTIAQRCVRGRPAVEKPQSRRSRIDGQATQTPAWLKLANSSGDSGCWRRTASAKELLASSVKHGRSRNGSAAPQSNFQTFHRPVNVHPGVE